MIVKSELKRLNDFSYVFRFSKKFVDAMGLKEGERYRLEIDEEEIR